MSMFCPLFSYVVWPTVCDIYGWSCVCHDERFCLFLMADSLERGNRATVQFGSEGTCRLSEAGRGTAASPTPGTEVSCRSSEWYAPCMGGLNRHTESLLTGLRQPVTGSYFKCGEYSVICASLQLLNAPCMFLHFVTRRGSWSRGLLTALVRWQVV